MDTEKRLLRPVEAQQFLANRGVQVSAATLATWRCKDPGRIPFRKIIGRIYYEQDKLLALLDEPTADGS